MDFGLGNSNVFGNNQEGSSSGRGLKYQRHTTSQIQHLEAVFKECPHPDEKQRRQLSMELGLEHDQIKFWFQNKRSQMRIQLERADNATLRADNERIYCENLALLEALRKINCSSCGGNTLNNEEGEEQHQRNLDCIKQENALLKEQHARVTALIEKQTAETRNLSDKDDIASGASTKIISDQEKSIMADTAAAAMNELAQLLRTNERLWIVSPTTGKYGLHRENYENLFPKASHLRSTTRFESSKDDCIVTLRGKQLVEIFADPNKWADLFPTIVTKASTVIVLSTGILGNNDGSLQLLDVQLHSLSPLVVARTFYLLRYCQQIEPGRWIIADVSYECAKESSCIIPSHCRRLPSGCMIEDMLNGCSKVTWVEHVEVEDTTQTHQLYRDMESSGAVYGAERWTATLRRMCERFTFSMEESMSVNESGRVCTSLEGKRGMKNLAHRMVKSFCAMLTMPGKTNFPHLYETSNSGVQVSVRKSIESGQPSGTIITASASLWLPLSAQDVFNFFTDERTRTKWDTLSNDSSIFEIIRIANGAHPGNSISIFEPHMRDENQMLILQETSIDKLGGLLVYAPVHISAINVALSGKNTSSIPILPSGFIISSDGRSDTSSRCVSSSSRPNGSSGSSLLTAAFQILVGNIPSSEEVDMESVSSITTLISSTVQKIKVALGCGDRA